MSLLGALQPIPLTARSYRNRVKTVGSPLFVNGMAEATTDGKSRSQAYPVTPREGLRVFAMLGDGAVRGAFEVDTETLYAVAGDNLYRIDSAGRSRLVGPLPGTGSARFARNRRTSPQVVCVSSGRAYSIEGSTITLLNIPSPGTGFITPIDVDFVLGYVVFITRAGSMHFTGIDDVTSLSALNFLTAEVNSDGLLRVMTRKLEIWLFGDRSIEIWVPTGDLSKPFARLGAGIIERGILAPASLVRISDRIVWVADDMDVVTVGDGYSPTSIADPSMVREIEALLKAGMDASQLEAFTYSVAGHDKYVLSCPAWTRVYDFHTQQWSDFKTEGMERWRASRGVFFGDRSLAGDVETGVLYEVTEDAYRDGDRPIVMTVRPPTVSAFPQDLCFFALFVDVEAGHDAGDLRVRWTDNGGRTWSPWRAAALRSDGQSIRLGSLGQSKRSGRQFEFALQAAEGRALVNVQAQVGVVSHP